MSQAVRRLTQTGIDQFRDYLKKLREGGTAEPDRSLLTDPKTSEPFDRPISMEDRPFPTRLELARYLTEVFDGIEGLEEAVGLWSWVSLLYFDQVCPPGPDRRRSPGRGYRHILEPGYPYGHRHLLGGPFLVYRLHGERARLLLSTRIYQENHFHHQLASRQTLISNPTIMEAADRLYFDERNRGPKRGAQHPGRTPGNLLRFIDVVQQLDLNYDLHSMSADALLDLLPAEFDQWRREKPF